MASDCEQIAPASASAPRDVTSLSTACVECDLLVEIPVLCDQRALCRRCGSTLSSQPANAEERAASCSIAALLFLGLAVAFPFLSLEARGIERVMTLPGAALEMLRGGHGTLAFLVAGPIAGIPALILVAVIALLMGLRWRVRQCGLVLLGRVVFALSPWAMAEVFIIGVLVSLIKVGSMANVVLGLSFWAYIAFVLCFVGALSGLDRWQIWRQIKEATA